jgi:hypothetical protein
MSHNGQFSYQCAHTRRSHGSNQPLPHGQRIERGNSRLEALRQYLDQGDALTEKPQALPSADLVHRLELSR